jgi:hypothetical protein
MRRIERARGALVMIAVFALALGAVGIADAGKGKRVKTKLVNTKIGPDGASGKIKSKQKACVKGRKVIVKGPEPFAPNAGAFGSATMVRIGTDKTNGKGRFSVPAPTGGSLNAGQYKIHVKKRKVKSGKRALASNSRGFLEKLEAVCLGDVLFKSG